MIKGWNVLSVVGLSYTEVSLTLRYKSYKTATNPFPVQPDAERSLRFSRSLHTPGSFFFSAFFLFFVCKLCFRSLKTFSLQTPVLGLFGWWVCDVISSVWHQGVHHESPCPVRCIHKLSLRSIVARLQKTLPRFMTVNFNSYVCSFCSYENGTIWICRMCTRHFPIRVRRSETLSPIALCAISFLACKH